MNPNGDINLVKKSAAGDEDAFHEIYRRHRNRVYGFAHRMTANGAVAEEIFRTGLCLPSGSAMTDADVDRVVDGVLRASSAG